MDGSEVELGGVVGGYAPYMEVVWCEVGSMGARFKRLSRGVRGDTVTYRGQP